jgi:hypothetical protein
LDIDVRSQVYFALRNAPDACGDRLAKAVLISVRMLLSVVLHHLERPKNVPRLIPLWMWGVAAGFARAVFFGRRLARFGEPMAPFVPFRRCLRQDS